MDRKFGFHLAPPLTRLVPCNPGIPNNKFEGRVLHSHEVKDEVASGCSFALGPNIGGVNNYQYYSWGSFL